MQIDLDAPLPDMWPQFEALSSKPLLAIRGEHSTLLEAKTLAEMQSRIPAMYIYNVKGQGHAPLLHVGDTAEQVVDFLQK
jgi:pimeloyl-ACP methyl ester carboxylesterase